MATDAPARPLTADRSSDRDGVGFEIRSTLMSMLGPMASLKFTVVLFAMSLFIVLAGTLAQAQADIWAVIDTYFRIDFAKLFTADFPWFHPSELFVAIPLEIFAPESFFHGRFRFPGYFPFPKGWVIGLFLGINLFAAHFVRFKVQAKGTRLWAGWALIALGSVVTWAVIMSGSDHDGLQNDFAVSWETVWRLLQGSAIVAWLGGVAAVVMGAIKARLARSITIGLCAVGAPLLIWMLATGAEVPIDPSGMRILWQLIKGTFAGAVLLAGCILVFNKRAGIVLLHGGIGLMMFYEVLVGVAADEGLMQIAEGHSSNFARDIRRVELAILSDADDGQDRVTVIPDDVLKQHRPQYKVEKKEVDGKEREVARRVEPGSVISHDELPFDVQFEDYYLNSELGRPTSEDIERVTQGVGKELGLVSIPPTAGAKTDAKVDMPGAYVRILKKGKPDEELARVMLFAGFDLQLFRPEFFENSFETIEVDGKEYRVSLRYERDYKPYSIALHEVSATMYDGSTIPRDYRSDITLTADVQGVKQDATIWMNNPLRFGGETFYQNEYMAISDDVEITTLQVVTNTGWMVPYVSCMIVAVGMFAQFMMTLSRFLRRKSATLLGEESFAGAVPAAASAASKRAAPAPAPSRGVFATWAPVAIAVAVMLWLGSRLISRGPAEGEFNLHAFGQIPVQEDGRLKPLDSVARNTLRLFCGRSEFVDPNERRQPAIRLLADMMKTVKPTPGLQAEGVRLGWRASDDYSVFKIENLEVQQAIGLKRKPKDMYSFNDLRPHWIKIAELVNASEESRKKTASEISTQQRRRDLKLGELGRKLLTYQQMIQSFEVHDEMISQVRQIEPNTPIFADMQANWDKLRAAVANEYGKSQYPRLIPALASDGESLEDKWYPYPEAAVVDALETTLRDAKPNPLVKLFGALQASYQADERTKFNETVEGYLGFISARAPKSLDPARIQYEHYFNQTEIYYYAAVASVIAFIMGAVSWLVNLDSLRRASFWIVAFLLVVHTFGLASRIYISGRPPVTNLYSSAIFIGWGAVALGLLLEWLYPIGMAVVIASFGSFLTLLIAHFLSIGNDTIGVLQAVLDTQFWLATHVVCITFGYATTFVAGFLGLAYVLRGMLTPTLTADVGKDLIRMIYGILCFSIFFSFVGTVLGGLWADDSWGRFWGWDPKENGALIIVIWNAIVLHARWGGLVKDRGLALLAIGGNIATAWSWFGVNELGVGLHAYGFTDGVLKALGISAGLQLLVITIAAIYPQKDWWSFRHQRMLDARK